MAKDAANNLSYYLAISEDKINHLGAIRKWNNLKAAFDKGLIWIKDFDYAQINSVEVKSIPEKQIFYERQGRLFLLNSLLPECIVPSLLWTSIERALPVKLPSFNHNYFGLKQEVAVRLVPSDHEIKTVASIVKIQALKAYLETAPEVRLRPLKWVLLNSDRALILGSPQLPVSGEVFWQQGRFLIPAGFNFDLVLLADELANRIDRDQDHWIMWNSEITYALIRKTDFMPLSLSSFTLSIQSRIFETAKI